MLLTKDKVKQIVDNRPVGVQPKQVIDSLMRKGYQLEGLNAPTSNINSFDQSVGQTAANFTPQGLYANSGLPGADLVKQYTVKPAQDVVTSAVAGGRNSIEQGFQSETKTDENGNIKTVPFQDRALNMGKDIAGGFYNTAAGIVNIPAGMVKDAKTIYQDISNGAQNGWVWDDGKNVDTPAIQGLNQAISGVTQIAASPLDMSPGSKGVASAPFAAIGGAMKPILQARGLNPDSPQGQEILNSIVNAAGAALMAKGMIKQGWLGTDESGNPIQPSIQGMKESIGDTIHGATDIPGLVKEGVKSIVDVFKPMPQRITEAKANQNQAAGEIIRGKTTDQATAVKALEEIDTKGVKTFKDIDNRFQKVLDDLRNQQDSELAKNPNPIPLKKLTQKITEGGKTASFNYVGEALNQLNELYTTTKDLPNAIKVKNLIDKAKSKGLTVAEINQIARTYGSEFGKKAFRADGTPLTSVNAQAFENVRSGIKDTARNLLPTELSKSLDGRMSDILQTKALIEKNIEAVNRLEQTTIPRGLGEKAGGLIADTANAFSLGGLKGFFNKLMPRNIGNKTMNWLDTQEKLSTNLSKIQRLQSFIDNNTKAAAPIVPINQPEFQGVDYNLNKVAKGEYSVENTNPIEIATNYLKQNGKEVTEKAVSAIVSDPQKLAKARVLTIPEDMLGIKLSDPANRMVVMNNLADRAMAENVFPTTVEFNNYIKKFTSLNDEALQKASQSIPWKGGESTLPETGGRPLGQAPLKAPKQIKMTIIPKAIEKMKNDITSKNNF